MSRTKLDGVSHRGTSCWSPGWRTRQTLRLWRPQLVPWSSCPGSERRHLPFQHELPGKRKKNNKTKQTVIPLFVSKIANSNGVFAFLCVCFNKMWSPRVSSIFIFIMNKYSTHLKLKISDPPKMEELAHKFVNDEKLKNLRGLWLVILQDHYISQFFSCWFSVTIFKSLIGSPLS